MRSTARSAWALALACVLTVPAASGLRPVDARATATIGTVAVTSARRPPTPIHVAEPARPRVVMPRAEKIRPNTVRAVRAARGVYRDGPPMLRPLEIDHVLRSAARRAPQRMLTVPRTASPTRRGAGSARAAQALPSDPNASGSGINPWWRYQEESVPGGGRLMVNVGTGNLVLQDDDMGVLHKGIEMAFRRTYNSQNAAASFTVTSGTVQSLYGNGWTSTFDAHLVQTAPGLKSVYDVDGTRYDYTADGSTNPPTYTSATPGQYATLVSDGTCGLFWTKKSGTVYYFYSPVTTKVCPNIGTVGGYAGRLYQIVGRNRNTSITFSYTWDNGDASPTGKINTITATTESGMTAVLAFADVNGRRLLQQLTFPDGATAVYYGYDGSGNLTWVSRPPNNSAGTRPVELYGYQTVGSDSVLQYAASPRWCQGSPSGCGYDGGYVYFTYAGSSATTSALNLIVHGATVNPPINDGTNASLHPGYAPDAYNFSNYLIEYWTTGVTTPTLRDTAGHYMNWVVDGLGRPVQMQECTSTVGQAQSCNGLLLTSNQGWDASNNLVSTTDARGNETDYAYDANGNTIAVGQPAVANSQGTFRPTSLYSYDSFNNVTAYCDPNAAHALGRDWSGVPAGDGLCPITSTLATRFVWSTDPGQTGTATAAPSYEPNGELIARINPGTASAPNGYRANFSYDPARQGGVDYGLPTAVTAASAFTQSDGTARQPVQNFWYDAHGRLGCFDKGNGQWVAQYDALGRIVLTADPDDGANNGICNKTTGTAGWNTAATTAFFPDGSVASKQTASQRAAGVSTTYTYDVDGNELTETHHYGCTSASSCTAGVTTKWYDGAERLVEVALPYDSHDIQGYPMMTRYIYDISSGGTTPYNGTNLRAYGNLVKTQELLTGTIYTPFTYAQGPTFTPFTLSTGSWTDVRATTYDAMDRTLASYEAAFSSQPKLANTYDGTPPGGSPELGYVSSVTLATNEVKQFTYDATGRLTDTTYAYDGGVTSPIRIRYDASGHAVSRGTDVLGNDTYQYDAAGELISDTKPASLGSATIGYGYYPDGTRRDLAFSSALYSANPLYQYAYRPDGRRSALRLNNGTSFTWTFTPGGRLTAQRDPLTGTTIHPDSQYYVGKRPHPYYPSSLTLVPESFSYDSYGRLSGVTLPAGVFTQAVTAYDLEDGIASFSATAMQPSAVVEAACASSNIRNEKLPTYRGGCGGYLYNGAAFSLEQSAWTGSPAGTGVAPWSLDARAGMLRGWTGPTISDGNTSGRQFSYDASGRLTGDAGQLDRPANANDLAQPNTRVYLTGTRTKTFDAENRLRSQYTAPASGGSLTSWGEYNPGAYFDDIGQGSYWQLNAVDYTADAHPTRFATQTNLGGAYQPEPYKLFWLWDGDDVLAQCMYDQAYWSQCSAYTFTVEGLAFYNPATNQIQVQDRGLIGQVVSAHDATTFAGMTQIGRPTRTLTNLAPFPGSTDGGGATPTSQLGTKLAADGWSLDNNTWQGVRTFDAAAGQFTTPDAFAGNVHDPMTQKPYMWNHNNPFSYSDPSGFDWGDVARNQETISKWMELSPVTGAAAFYYFATLSHAGQTPLEEVYTRSKLDASYVQAVIGSYPLYKNMANDLQKRWFHVPDEVWKNMERKGTAQAHNDAWIEKGVRLGWTFLVVQDPSKEMGKGLKAEIQLLIEKYHYHWSDDGMMLLPPGVESPPRDPL